MAIAVDHGQDSKKRRGKPLHQRGEATNFANCSGQEGAQTRALDRPKAHGCPLAPMRELSAERRILGHQGARMNRKARGRQPKSIRQWQIQTAVFRARSNGNLDNRACFPSALAFRTWYHTCYRRIRKLAWFAPDSTQLCYENGARFATRSARLRVCKRCYRRCAQHGKTEKLTEARLGQGPRKSVTLRLVAVQNAQSWASAPSRALAQDLLAQYPLEQVVQIGIADHRCIGRRHGYRTAVDTF